MAFRGRILRGPDGPLPDGRTHLCLSDLIDQDLTSYEYFHSLPTDVRNELLNRDISTFEELRDAAARIQNGFFREMPELPPDTAL